MSSPAILRRSGSNNATHLNVHRSSRQHRPSSSDLDHQSRASFVLLLPFFIDLRLDLHSLKKDSPTEMVDIDERLKSLEKFMKENLPS